MTPLQRLLVRVPAVYAELGRSLTPGGGVGGERVSGNPRVEAPDVANLAVVEHRHKLLRGLRWWVDAVSEDRPRVGDSPAAMCAVLLRDLVVMAPEDRETLHLNLSEWEAGALPMIGAVETPAPVLPLEALDRVVPVHVAARVLGVSVSTVQRRAPRVAGMVVLRDAAGPVCVMSDLPAAWCAHCRGVRTVA